MLKVHSRWTSATVPHEFVNFFVCNIEKLIVWCIPAKKNYYNLTKNNHEFQASVTERCTFLSKSSATFCQNPLKAHELLHKWLLRFSGRFFLPFYRSLFVLLWQTYFVFVFVFVKSISSRFYYSWDGKRSFWITFAALLHLPLRITFAVFVFVKSISSRFYYSWDGKRSFCITFAAWFDQFIQSL